MNLSNGVLTISIIKKEDMPFIQKLWGDEESMLASGGVYQVRDEDIDQLFGILNKKDEVNNHYIIKYENQSIGDLSIRKMDEKMTANLDMKILHKERNKGYGKEALKLILDYFFNQLDGSEIYFELWLVNYFAQHKLKEYGFKATLIMEDATIMTLTKEDYKEGVLNV